MIKIMIADDKELIRSSLEIILNANPNFKVIASVADGTEVLSSIEEEKPDIILMDIRMPKMDGTVATKYVKEKYPEIKVIILTTFDDDDFIFSALKYGASGYVLKGVSTKELYQTIETVNQGGAMINPDIAGKVFKWFSRMAQSNYTVNPDDQATNKFSKKELRVIQQVGFGLSNKEIAAKLYLSEGTVRNYISSILAELELRDRTQLAIWAVQNGITAQDIDDE